MTSAASCACGCAEGLYADIDISYGTIDVCDTRLVRVKGVASTDRMFIMGRRRLVGLRPFVTRLDCSLSCSVPIVSRAFKLSSRIAVS